jgi:type II secretory pathway component GspD/PulD (secretin)
LPVSTGVRLRQDHLEEFARAQNQCPRRQRGSNVVIVSDRYANLRRIEAVIRELDAIGVVAPRVTRADTAAESDGNH